MPSQMSGWALVTALLFATRVAAVGATSIGDAKPDGDGRSGFCKIHKYRMDPHKQDAGKGVLDGDPTQRREFI